MEPSAETVLFVCTANVCRSPLAMFLTQLQLSHTHLRVRSAGVDAAPGAHLCDETAEYLWRLGCGADFQAAHRSQRLNVALIDDAALILTAAKAHRSAIARVRPGARERTFTIVEAARLASQIPSLVLDPSGASVSDVARLMHQNRWRLATRPLRPDRWADRIRATRNSDPLSVPDYHAGEARSHKLVFGQLHGAVTALCSILPPVTGATHWGDPGHSGVDDRGA